MRVNWNQWLKMRLWDSRWISHIFHKFLIQNQQEWTILANTTTTTMPFSIAKTRHKEKWHLEQGSFCLYMVPNGNRDFFARHSQAASTFLGLASWFVKSGRFLKTGNVFQWEPVHFPNVLAVSRMQILNTVHIQGNGTSCQRGSPCLK